MHRRLGEAHYLSALRLSSSNKIIPGPALRMGPNEVHIYDPAFYHELYRPNSKYYKDPEMHKVLGAPSSTLAECDPVKHKQRRAPLEPLFAKKNVLKLESMLMEHVDYCSQRFDEFYAAGRPVSMEWALKSLAMGTLRAHTS